MVKISCTTRPMRIVFLSVSPSHNNFFNILSYSNHSFLKNFLKIDHSKVPSLLKSIQLTPDFFIQQWDTAIFAGFRQK